MNAYLRLFRPHQYTKKLIIFLPALFGGKLHLKDVFLNDLTGFVSFCLAASSAYIVNDILDIRADRKHPEKMKRPIPSGIVSKTTALVIAVVSSVAGLILALT